MKRVSRKRPRLTERNGYHHGNLRTALLRAAEEIIRESGAEGLTLRACARRAGVSHGAPAHHFQNITGLLTELAAEGFERLTEAMTRKNVDDADDDLQAAGLGYIQFAMRWPEHFRVMWRSELLNEESPRLRKARQMAQQRLHAALIKMNAHGRTLTEAELAARFQLASCCVHGYASLWVEGNRRSRSLEDAKHMLRLLRASLAEE